MERSIRELESKIEELTEDLDAEKASRSKAERQRKEISEVCQPSFYVNMPLTLYRIFQLKPFLLPAGIRQLKIRIRRINRHDSGSSGYESQKRARG